MWSKIAGKLTLALLLVAVLTIVLTIFLINFALDYQFTSYLQRAEDERNTQVILSIEALYQETPNWNQIASQIINLSMFVGSNIQIEDLNGNLIIDTSQRRRPTMMRHHREFTNQEVPENSHTTVGEIFFDQQKIAKAYITSLNPIQGVYSSEDILFRNTINRSIIIAGILASIFALITSFLISTRLSSPIKRLTKVAQKMGEGELNQRVTISGNDEISILAEEFNEMANNLNQLNELRKKLTADVAHELRTPLTTIKGYLEGIQDGVLPLEKNLAVVDEEVQRLTQLVTDLQELARAEAPLCKKTSVEIGVLLLDIIDKVNLLVQEKNIKLNYNKNLLQSCKIETLGDYKALSRALSNILINAIKYTSADGVVDVNLELDSDWVKISFRDSGIGISQQDIPFIFERFYRADHSRARQTGGTGIGLAIAKEIIQSHGGCIEVTSELNVGSTFIISLPVEKKH